MTPSEQPPPGPNDPQVLKAVDLLAKEYEFHRNEIMKHLEVYNQQNTYIQVFVAGLLTFAFAVLQYLYAAPASPLGKLVQDAAASNKPIVTLGVLIALLIGASITWYFIASIAGTHYMFNVLRHRMKKIEAQVNHFLGREVWIYESQHAQRYITSLLPLGPRLNPIVPPVFARLSLLLCIVYVLGALASVLLPPLSRSCYTAALIVCTLSLLASSLKEILPWTRQDLETPPGTARQWVGSLYNVVFALILIVGFLSRDQLAQYIPTVAALERWLEVLSAHVLLSLVFSVLYSAFSLVPFFPPSELPMILVPVHGWTWILVSCAFGKGVAALLALYFLSWLDRLTVMLTGRRLTQLAETTNWIMSLIRRWSTLGFFVAQAVPFFPMRLGLVVFLVLKKPSFKLLFFTMAHGTVVRNAAMFLGIKYGLIPIHRLFNQ
jgi:hypothetical protein